MGLSLDSYPGPVRIVTGPRYMCKSCWVDAGCPVAYDEDVAEAVSLIKRLYELEPTGGPLHVELDDMNLHYDTITPSYSLEPRQAADGSPIPGYPDRYSVEVHELCDRIAEILTPMTEGWRISVVAHWEGWATEGQSMEPIEPEVLCRLGSKKTKEA